MSALKGVGMVGLRMSVRSRVVQEGFMNLKKDSSGPTVSPNSSVKATVVSKVVLGYLIPPCNWRQPSSEDAT